MLSRETLISMLKNEYPSSYNAHDVDNMSVQELDALLDYLDSMQNKANGGMMLDNTKTYHQANDYTAPPDLEVMIGYANGGGVGSMMVPKKKFEMQGGVRNYLGKQKEVKAPLNWQSSPDHPKTELAYITKKEKDLLVKKDLHGSLKGGVNRGPSGIMSLNGWGSKDKSGKEVGMSGAATSAAETGSKNQADIKEVQAYMGPKGLPPGVMPKEAQDYRNAFIAAGGGQRVNPGFFDSRNYVGPGELAAAKAYNPAAFAAGRRGSGLLGFLGGGGILGALIRGLGQKFGWGKTAGEPTYDMSEFNTYGLGGSKNPDYYNDLGNEIVLGTTGSKKLVTPPGWTIQDEMVDVSSYRPPPTGIMKAGGYPGNWGTTPFDPSMGNRQIDYSMSDQFLDQNPEVRNMLGINRNLNTTPVNTNTYDQNIENWRNQNDVNFMTVGMNQKQKDLIDKAATTYGKVNADFSGNPGKLDTSQQTEIFDQAKNLDTKAESGLFGTGWGATEADPMTQEEYKEYLVSQGYI